MNKFEKDCIKSSLIKLARLRCTGTPSEFAGRYDISQRTVKRYIKELKDKGLEIYYDYNCVSYVIKKDDNYVVKHIK